MAIKQEYIDFLTSLGQKLQASLNLLDEAREMLLENDLDGEFIDGVVNGKMEFLTDGLQSVVDNVAEELTGSVEVKAQEEVVALANQTTKAVRAIQSGQAFGAAGSEESKCSDCNAADCSLRDAAYEPSAEEILGSTKK